MSEQPNRDKKGDRKSRNRRFVFEFVGCVVVIVAVIAFAPLIIEWWQSYIGSEGTLGEFGDQFGVANALFAGLAFAGVIVAMRMQSRELQIQQVDLDDTQKIMSGQQKQLELQAASMQQQRFDNRFFQLVSLYHQTVNQITFSSNSQQPSLHGKEAISAYLIFHKQDLPKHFFPPLFGEDNELLPENDQRAAFIHDYHLNKWYSSFGDQFGHYFRHVYHVYKFIDAQHLDADKEFYSAIIRAQLSQAELYLLFYNSVSWLGREKALPLYFKHGLFDNLDHAELCAEGDWDVFSHLAMKDEKSI